MPYFLIEKVLFYTKKLLISTQKSPVMNAPRKKIACPQGIY